MYHDMLKTWLYGERREKHPKLSFKQFSVLCDFASWLDRGARNEIPEKMPKENIDKAIVNGTGNEKGPMEEAQQFEPDDLVKRLERLSKEFDKKIFGPTRMIREGGYLKG